MAGTTASTNFPTTTTAFQQTTLAGNTGGTAFVSRFDTTKVGAVSLLYSTYLGGDTAEFGDAIALGPSNVAYVTGSTNSLLFPATSGSIPNNGKCRRHRVHHLGGYQPDRQCFAQVFDIRRRFPNK